MNKQIAAYNRSKCPNQNIKLQHSSTFKACQNRFISSKNFTFILDCLIANTIGLTSR